VARNRAEACIFCGTLPCSCNDTPAPPKAKLVERKDQAPRTPTEQPVTPPRQGRALPKSSAHGAASPVLRTVKAPDTSSDDADMRRAITILCQSGLVGSEEIKRHRSMLDMTPVEIDSLVWRMRRHEYLAR
jgi:hypothetical protein